VALLIFAGAIVRLVDRRHRLESWIAQVPQAADNGRLDIVVPPAVLGGLALVGLIMFSVVGCYAYYPGAPDVFDEMSIAKSEALSAGLSGDVTHAEY
jgi:hypothetical protein